MRRIFPLAVLGLVLATGAAVPSHAMSLGNATFVDANGAFNADFSWSGGCVGLVTLNVVIHRPTGDDVRSVGAKSIMVPDLCGIACLDCPVPFTWTLENPAARVALTGGGMAGLGAAWSLQGSFMEGALEVRGVGTTIIIP